MLQAKTNGYICSQLFQLKGCLLRWKKNYKRKITNVILAKSVVTVISSFFSTGSFLKITLLLILTRFQLPSWLSFRYDSPDHYILCCSSMDVNIVNTLIEKANIHLILNLIGSKAFKQLVRIYIIDVLYKANFSCLSSHCGCHFEIIWPSVCSSIEVYTNNGSTVVGIELKVILYYLNI